MPRAGNLKQDEQEYIDIYELLEKSLASSEGLSVIKKKSVTYIEEKNSCPVCNKPISERDKMISTLNGEIKKLKRVVILLTLRFLKLRKK